MQLEYEIFDIRSAFFTHSLPSSIGEDVWATISARFTMIRGPIDFVLQRENRRVWPARVQTRRYSRDAGRANRSEPCSLHFTYERSSYECRLLSVTSA